MRTTIKLDDDVFRAYKQRAAERGTTFAKEVEDALRADMRGGAVVDEEPFEMLVFEGDDSPALIDISDNRAIQELFDEEDRAAGRW